MNMRELESYFQTGSTYSEAAKKAAIDAMIGKYTHQLSLGDWEKVLTLSKSITDYRKADIEAKIADRIGNCGNGSITKDVKAAVDKFAATDVGSTIMSFWDPKYYKTKS